MQLFTSAISINFDVTLFNFNSFCHSCSNWASSRSSIFPPPPAVFSATCFPSSTVDTCATFIPLQCDLYVLSCYSCDLCDLHICSLCISCYLWDLSAFTYGMYINILFPLYQLLPAGPIVLHLYQLLPMGPIQFIPPQYQLLQLGPINIPPLYQVLPENK